MARPVNGVWAVIPSAGRPYIGRCLDAVEDQVDGVVIVANDGYDHLDDECVVVEYGGPVNISRWWNLGLDEVPDGSDVLILNDDTVMYPGSVDALATGLRSSGASLAFPGTCLRRLSPGDPERITGWCFMLSSRSRLRADESLVWWYGDNDLDWRARQEHGSVTVPWIAHDHLDPNGYTNRVPSLAAQTSVDRQTFFDKWGHLPH